MDISIFQEFYDLNITALPIIWDLDKKIAAGHPEHDTGKIDVNMTYVQNLLLGNVPMFEKFSRSNAVALKMISPFGMFDFDLKNTPNKNVYRDWFEMVQATNEDIFKKVCIELTRSGGYHVYIKYAKLDHKIPVARSEGKEVISVYTGELLSYCSPTPGYSIIHNGWEDIEMLTDEEFQFLVTCAAFFNEDADFIPTQSTIHLIDYPVEYESTCLQFDQKINNETFDILLNSIGLVPVPDPKPYQKKPWNAFIRVGSTGAYSAKVYYKNKRCLLFTASMPKFPSWHDSAKMNDKNWSLSPSKIVFYKNDKDWSATIEEIKCICDSAGVDITYPEPVTQQPVQVNDRMKFPFDIFPDSVNNFIGHQTLQPEYIAGFMLGALSTAIGNSVQLEATEGYLVKPIMYIAVVAPPGSSKSPALRKAFAPLERHDALLYDQHKLRMKQFRSDLAEAKKNKTEEPEQPTMEQSLIKDSTIEMVIKILSLNKAGCCVLADELSGFLKRMNQYKDGDEVQKWLELWSGAPVLMQRISREENKVQEPYCNVVGGIQPGVLESLSKDDNQHNGFYHRFLFCYPQPQEKKDFGSHTVPYAVTSEYNALFDRLMYTRQKEKETYILSGSALALYKEWFDYKNKKYNSAPSDNVKGIIAKYQDYCLRFAILIQVINEDTPTGIVTHIAMNGAIRLTEYFLGNMHKALKLLSPETPIDNLSEVWQQIYSKLPQAFTTKTIVTLAAEYKIKDTAAKMFLTRNVKKLFYATGRGEYEKML